MSPLLNCPFCGGEKIGGPYRDEREGLFYVACISKPGSSCAAVHGRTREEAAERWNRRAPPEQSAAGHPVAVDGGKQAPQRSETERSTND